MTEPKICPKCHEKNHPQLNQCWKCGYVFDAVALELENKKPSKENSFKEILIPGMFLFGLFWIFSLAALTVTATVGKGSAERRNWSTVEGKVTKSEIRKNINSNLPYDAIVEYQYSVDGKSYIGRNRTFQMHPHAKEAVSKIVASYPNGKIVTVYYDPKNPTIECLELGSGFSSFQIFYILLFVVMTLVLIAGGGIWLFYARSRRDGGSSNYEPCRKAMIAGMKQCPHCGKIFNFFSFWVVFGLMASLDDPMRRATNN